MHATRHEISLTTDESGDVTAYTPASVSGRIFQIQYVKDDFDAGSTITLTGAKTAVPIFAITGMNDSATHQVRNIRRLGAELVTNGTFTGNADNWNLDAGWAYGGNAVTVTADGTNLFLTQTGTSLVLGTMYRIKYDISASDMDGTGLSFSGGSAFGYQNLNHTNGTHIYHFPKTNASPTHDIKFYISENSTPGKVLTIDNISIREVFRQYTKTVIAGERIKCVVSGGGNKKNGTLAIIVG